MRKSLLETYDYTVHMPLKVIEKAEVTCIVDNIVDVLLQNTKIAYRPNLDKNWFINSLIAEHGFCVALKLQINGTEHKLLFDTGLSPISAVHNANVLGMDLTLNELVVSSHGHVDHSGGLLNLPIKIKEKEQKQKIPLIIHEEAFKNRMVKFKDGRIINLPAPNRSNLIHAGYTIVEEQSPSLWFDDCILVTGEVPRTNDFEKGFPNHYSEVDGKMESDPLIRDDQSIILNIKDKGLVIITGCAHSGIINSIRYAQELSGEDHIYAILGGMHLSGEMFESLIPRTINELERLAPEFIIPCHCSGLKAASEISKVMSNAFIQNSVGTTYTF